MTTFRIHGDNIVECERIVNLISNGINIKKQERKLISPSVIAIELEGVFKEIPFNWKFILLPGFNKNTKRRWESNIFEPLKKAGSYFDETPDALISKVLDNEKEIVVLGIEFCSALQAGNQAWQRSARAFSTGRTGCPYLYIVDFVKYELENTTRERKNLRFPNAAVPFSYVCYSRNVGSFVSQVYVKSEEFDISKDKALVGFNEQDFGEKDLSSYIIKLLLDENTKEDEERLLQKNMNIVKFLAAKSNSASNFTSTEWQEIYQLKDKDIVDFSVEKHRFHFHKTIASKSLHGQSEHFISLIDKLSVGLASQDLPFGIIPASHRSILASELQKLYPSFSRELLHRLGSSDKHLIVAIFKGFKPRGDDNRPDRGLLPLAAMLSDSNSEVLSFIYGPIIEANLKKLDKNPIALANQNGLWRSILALSNYVILDAPVLGSIEKDAIRLIDSSKINHDYNEQNQERILPSKLFSCATVNYGEDDVDTALHYFFTSILQNSCFEGMCNPPGGDWSGFSVISGGYEHRWLSLPRVSDVVNGKRPDHIIELYNVFEKPLLLSIESKEKSVDLEPDVGEKLIAYIKELMSFVPSARRKRVPAIEQWKWATNRVEFCEFEAISAAAYLKKYAEPSQVVFSKKCEILFVLDPIDLVEKTGWSIEIIPSTKRSQQLKEFLIKTFKATGNNQFVLS